MALIPVRFTFADDSLASDVVAVPGWEVGNRAAVQVDLHDGFPTAAAVELRFASGDASASFLARYNAAGTLISFAGADERQVALDPTDYCCVKGYAKMVSDTTIATGGITTVWLREV